MRQLDACLDLIDDDRIVEWLSLLVDTPSPTGEEGVLARKVCEALGAAGIEAREQVLDDKQSNAVGCLPGFDASSSGLLLYAPIDTVTSNSEAEDLPWAGDKLRQDMRAETRVEKGYVYGLGAHNPKGHVACVLAAGEVLRRSQMKLKRPLFLGLGAGGMPTNSRAGIRPDSGHGVGCGHMLANLDAVEAAVIAKSGWSISWEEVGLAWITVNVRGDHTYVGSRHLLPYRSAIHDAARLIEGLELWFAEWSQRHTSGLVAPQGVVSQIEGGWQRMPAFTPAVCRFQLDLRVSPRTSAEQVDEEFGAEFDRLCKVLGVNASWERTVYIPGTTTPFDADIIQRSISAWEDTTGKKHAPVKGLSGATDANILRLANVPTARVGLPKADLPELDFALGMNAVKVSDLVQLTKLLVRIAFAYCVDREHEGW